MIGHVEDHNLCRIAFSDLSACEGWKDELVGDKIQFPGTELEVNESGIPMELGELGKLIASLRSPSQPELQVAFQTIVDSVRRRHRILSLVQEALSQLRLDIKYLMFDLDATRKERDELREQMEDR